MKNFYLTLLCIIASTVSTNLTAQCVNDSTPPLITGCPADIQTCQGAVSWTEPTASDNCGLLSFTSDHLPGSTFPSGTTKVTYTAKDIHGNISTCSFNVTVNIPPGDPSASIVKWSWDFGDVTGNNNLVPLSATAQIQKHTFNNPSGVGSQYFVGHSAVSNFGCASGPPVTAPAVPLSAWPVPRRRAARAGRSFRNR